MKRIAVLAIALIFTGCTDKTCVPVFNVGDLVTAKLDGRRGQVIQSWGCDAPVTVRFPAQQLTTSAQPYATMRMETFELEPVR